MSIRPPSGNGNSKANSHEKLPLKKPSELEEKTESAAGDALQNENPTPSPRRLRPERQITTNKNDELSITKSFFSDAIPEDIWQEFVSRLDTDDLAQFMLVSKASKITVESAYNDFLWLKEQTSLTDAVLEEFSARLRLKNKGVIVPTENVLAIFLIGARGCQVVDLRLPTCNAAILSSITKHGSQIKSLSLQIAQCNNNAPLSFTGLKSLEALTLNNCPDLNVPLDISKLSSLVHFRMTNCPQFSQKLDCTQNANLTEIFLNFCSDLVHPPKVEGLSSLERLNLANCPSLIDAPALIHCHSLKMLELQHSGITAAPIVKELAQLELLDLSTCNIQLPPDVTGCSSLKQLNFYMCVELTLPPNTHNLKKLESINLEFCVDLQQPPDLYGCRSLVSVNLAKCPNLHQAPRFENLPNLKTVLLESCENLNQKIVISNCPRLEAIDLTNVPRLYYPDLSDADRARIQITNEDTQF